MRLRPNIHRQEYILRLRHEGETVNATSGCLRAVELAGWWRLAAEADALTVVEAFPPPYSLEEYPAARYPGGLPR